MPSARHPLAGIKVLDVSRILAGPVCCQVLADLGADVVKVERPGTGDDTRSWGPPFLPDDGPATYYLSANRGKRSLALDLTNESGRAVLDDLLRAADAMVENFLPSSLAKLGLEPQRISALNPRLVSCSISGYGRTGPLANVPGYDLVIQATAGLMSITGEPDGAPMKVGVAITDVITGLYGAISILAGLHARGDAGAGTAFDVALADCTIASLVNVAQSALVTGQRPRRYGNAHQSIVPYEAFATADGHIVFGVGNDRQWQRFCATVDRHDLAIAARFASNQQRVEHRDELIPLLQALFARRTTDEWLRLLAAAEIPNGPVLTFDQIAASPQVAAREMILDTVDSEGRAYQVLGSPLHWRGAAERTAQAPPALGQHTDEVLVDWLAYDRPQVDRLRVDGVIA